LVMETSPIGRIPILDVSPHLVESGWSAKSFVGEVVPFAATCFFEGHDALGVALHLKSPDGTSVRYPMAELSPGTDQWGCQAQVTVAGMHAFTIEAYSDDYATWQHNAKVKIPLGLDVDVTFLMGSQLFARAAKEASRPAASRKRLSAVAKKLADATLDPMVRLAHASSPELERDLKGAPISSTETFTASYPLRVERRLAGVGNWYEFFPRSEGAVRAADGSWTSGTFRTAAKRLPAVAQMGFTVLYMPPIHPIGFTGRKGPNNTLTPGPHDPGSPWAIGSAAGGHDAVHPELGTMADFTYFLKKARENGIELALDLALQASPDHPWVTEHPEFFTTLPDGTIAFAENPPKKYQDIYPINFDNDPDAIRTEVLRVVRHWIAAGVTIFRVDNPHTKPVNFWEWLIATVNQEFPEVIFLAEAFTRPAMMQTLAKAGFQQSYTYFTWRNTAGELAEFFTSLATETADFMRPNLFVTTPDILPAYLQFGGRPAAKIRAALAATASPTWGIYSGFELGETVARPGAEEHIDSEKFEFTPRDWVTAEKAGTSLSGYLQRLNEIRAEHPALGQLRNLTVHRSDNEGILVFSKHLAAEFSPTGVSDTLIVVVNTDPHAARETTIHVDMTTIGLEHGDEIVVTDLITGDCWQWAEHNYARLDPFIEPAHILHVTGASRG
jgi:starch synthase (maltosyl-transferring)